MRKLEEGSADAACGRGLCGLFRDDRGQQIYTASLRYICGLYHKLVARAALKYYICQDGCDDDSDPDPNSRWSISSLQAWAEAAGPGSVTTGP